MYTYTPATDLFTSDDAFLLTLDVPGVSEDEIDVTVEGRTLTFRAGGGEDSTPHWFRRFALPRGVDVDSINATHTDGVLSLRIPRLANGGARRVSING